MANDTDKKKDRETGEEGATQKAAPNAKPAAFAQNWPELTDRLIHGDIKGIEKFLMLTIGGGAVLTLIGQGDLRAWSGSLLRNGALQMERRLNWTINHLQGCLRSLLFAGLFNFLFIVPAALFVAGTCHDPATKAVLETILGALFVLGLAAPYYFWAPYLVRFGLYWGAFDGVSPEEGKEFAEGGILPMLFGAVPSALQGVRDALWAPVKRMSRLVTFVLVTFFAFIPFDWASQPILVLLVPFIGMMFGILHGTWEPKERGFEWHYLHSAFLYIIGVLFLLVVAPMILAALSIPMDNWWGVVRSIILVMSLISAHKLVQGNAQKSFDANQVILGLAKPASGSAKKESSSKKDSSASGSYVRIDWAFMFGLAFLALVFVWGSGCIRTVNYAADHSMTLSNFLSEHNFRKSPVDMLHEGNMNTHTGELPYEVHGATGGGVAQAATVTSERVDSTLAWTISVKAQSGAIPTNIPMISGASYEVTVLEGTYTFDDATLTTSGTWNGKVTIPSEHPGWLGNYYRDMVNTKDPVGQLYVMPGLHAEECPVVNDHSYVTVEKYATADMAPNLFDAKDHFMYLKLNVPQQPGYSSKMTGNLKIRVRRVN